MKGVATFEVEFGFSPCNERERGTLHFFPETADWIIRIYTKHYSSRSSAQLRAMVDHPTLKNDVNAKFSEFYIKVVVQPPSSLSSFVPCTTDSHKQLKEKHPLHLQMIVYTCPPHQVLCNPSSEYQESNYFFSSKFRCRNRWLTIRAYSPTYLGIEGEG